MVLSGWLDHLEWWLFLTTAGHLRTQLHMYIQELKRLMGGYVIVTCKTIGELVHSVLFGRTNFRPIEINAT